MVSLNIDNLSHDDDSNQEVQINSDTDNDLDDGNEEPEENQDYEEAEGYDEDEAYDEGEEDGPAVEVERRELMINELRNIFRYRMNHQQHILAVLSNAIRAIILVHSLNSSWPSASQPAKNSSWTELKPTRVENINSRVETS